MRNNNPNREGIPPEETRRSGPKLAMMAVRLIRATLFPTMLDSSIITSFNVNLPRLILTMNSNPIKALRIKGPIRVALRNAFVYQ